MKRLPALAASLFLLAGCGDKSDSPAPATEAGDGGAATVPAETAETAAAVKTAIAEARADARAQNYSNAVHRLDGLRNSGRLSPNQLMQIHDAEANLLRDLAAKAAAGDANARRQLDEIADRPRRAR